MSAPSSGRAASGMSARDAWILAARPRTLPVAAAPVLVGSAVAASEGGARVGPALAALLGAFLLQIASNFANDLFDAESGADNADRIGPPRATQLGLLSPQQMWRGTLSALAAAGCAGIYLVWVAGWPIIAVGLLSAAAALAYTGGPWPFGYRGLGDPAVFLFFGVIAVVGSCFVQTGVVSPRALLASLSVGALATAILVVNNVRDIDTDRAAGKRTLAVRLGRHGARVEYVALVAGAYALLPIYWWLGQRSAWVLLPLLSAPLAAKLVAVVRREVAGPPLNEALAGTAKLTLLFSLLLSLGWLI